MQRSSSFVDQVWRLLVPIVSHARCTLADLELSILTVIINGSSEDANRLCGHGIALPTGTVKRHSNLVFDGL
jgi:hypothetical protein